ncbi:MULTISPECIES: DsbA family protein [Tsukamurella]|uniref:DSBA-like thioredoxin domain-containing protein n=1 Tax=Tsukamurella pulmonis TaxID=47312 RepID=A0A1H1AES4_9ACTN|nr:DsbA family protein [Tsukamurella pulmonis]SDQ38159.1 hypothetical protein SAMN04489765_0189 [Tsukamurella pulmonis]SUQ39347.1 Uncharacterised protein [Tsukamurella pulmonis]
MNRPLALTIWLDPVCPYSWTTAQWLLAAVDNPNELQWKQMSLALLNEGRELPEPARKRMQDSRAAGRLFASLARELDSERMWQALRTFSDQYHRDGGTIDDQSVREMLLELDLPAHHISSIDDPTFDAAVRDAHTLSQEAAGESAGSPLIGIGETVFHGPVLTAIPAPTAARDLLTALETLATVETFASVQRFAHPSNSHL